MTDRASLIGSADPAFEMAIERGKIREFARACMSTNPAYLEGRHPVIPPTFLATSAFWSTTTGQGAGDKLGLDNKRVLHGGQDIVFHGPPPHAGDELTSQTRIADVYEKEGKRGGTMTFVEIVQELRNADGTLVAEVRNTIIETGKAPEAS